METNRIELMNLFEKHFRWDEKSYLEDFVFEFVEHADVGVEVLLARGGWVRGR